VLLQLDASGVHKEASFLLGLLAFAFGKLPRAAFNALAADDPDPNIMKANKRSTSQEKSHHGVGSLAHLPLCLQPTLFLLPMRLTGHWCYINAFQQGAQLRSPGSETMLFYNRHVIGSLALGAYATLYVLNRSLPPTAPHLTLWHLRSRRRRSGVVGWEKVWGRGGREKVWA
jgi:hypothetical protein